MLFEASVGERTVRVEVREKQDRYTVVLDGRSFEVDVHEPAPGFLSLLIEGHSHEVGLERQGNTFDVRVRGQALAVELSEAAAGSAAPVRRPGGGPVRVTAPMPGRVVRLLVSAGQQVRAGEGLVVMEAMKMENELRAPRAGRVQRLEAREGQAVESGALLVLLE